MDTNKKFLSVRNMGKYQHYKKDKPVWIKLYKSLWSEREFSVLPDATKAHIIGLVVLCSQNGNLVPFNDVVDRKWIEEEIKAREIVNFDLILSTGLIVVSEDTKNKNSRDSLDKCYAQKRREEKRREEKIALSSNFDSEKSNLMKSNFTDGEKDSFPAASALEVF